MQTFKSLNLKKPVIRARTEKQLIKKDSNDISSSSSNSPASQSSYPYSRNLMAHVTKASIKASQKNEDSTDCSSAFDRQSEASDINDKINQRAIYEDILIMKSLLPMKKQINAKKMLFSVEDEADEIEYIDELLYISVFKKAHKNIVTMTTDQKKHRGSFLVAPHKLESKIKSLRKWRTIYAI